MKIETVVKVAYGTFRWQLVETGHVFPTKRAALAAGQIWGTGEVTIGGATLIVNDMTTKLKIGKYSHGSPRDAAVASLRKLLDQRLIPSPRWWDEFAIGTAENLELCDR